MFHFFKFVSMSVPIFQPVLTILPPVWFLIVTLVFFWLSFEATLNVKVAFLHRKHESIYRDISSLTVTRAMCLKLLSRKGNKNRDYPHSFIKWRRHELLLKMRCISCFEMESSTTSETRRNYYFWPRTVQAVEYF